MLLTAAVAWLCFDRFGQPDAEGWTHGELTGALRWGALAIVGGALAVPRLTERWRSWLCLAAVALACFTMLAHLLRSTLFSLGGDSQDSGFIIQQLVVARHFGWPVDGTYRGLSAFYPPLYTQLLGKTAAMLDLPAASTWKLGGLVATLIVPALAFFGWARIVGTRAALAVVMLTAFSAPVMHMHKTHEWITLQLFLPWWLACVFGLTRRARGLSARRLAGCALAGGALFATFYYEFFIGGVALLLHWASGMLRGRRPHLRGALVLAGAALVASPYWGPLLIDLVTIDNTPLQQRWFRPSMNDFPLRTGWGWRAMVSWGGVAALLPWGWIGQRFSRIGWLIAREGEQHACVALSALRSFFVAGLLWHVLGRIAAGFDAPILHVKAVPLLYATLFSAFGIGAVVLARRLPSQGLTRVAIAVVVLGAAHQDVRAYGRLGRSKWTRKALEKEGSNPERRALRKTRDVDGLMGKTVLTSEEREEQYLPGFQFLGLSAHYAHPASRFEERYAFVRGLVKLDDARGFCVLLRHNRFDPVDYVWWPPGHRKFVYLDDFPNGVRTGHLTWASDAREGDCLERVGQRGWTRRMLHVRDPGLGAVRDMSPAARELALRYGDSALRAAVRRADPGQNASRGAK
ncbi:MAG: arabinofuranosyltransferase [Myxococcales bacterium]